MRAVDAVEERGFFGWHGEQLEGVPAPFVFEDDPEAQDRILNMIRKATAAMSRDRAQGSNGHAQLPDAD